MGIERRKSVRVYYTKPIEIYLSDIETKFITGYTENISTGGLLVVVPQDIPVESKLRVILEIEIGEKSKTLSVHTIVRWCKEIQGSYRCGLEYINLSIDKYRLIEKLIDSLPHSEYKL